MASFVVVFQDENGKVLKTAFAPEGSAVEAPELPKIKEQNKHFHIEFAGWDTPLDNIRRNLVIKPVYKKVLKTYLVMYLSEEGKMLGMENVPYGEAAKQEIVPVKRANAEYEYIFRRWNQDITAVEKDMTVKPVFARRKRKYPVHFYDGENQEMKKEMVRYGEFPKAPSNARKTEDNTYFYEFSGWNPPVSLVTGEVFYHANFNPIYKEYHLSVYNEDEEIVSSLHHYGEDIELPVLHKKGYTLHWDHPINKIEKDTVIHSFWEFSNPKGSVHENRKGKWKIINPSIHHGTVSCVKYNTKNAVEKMPDKIKVGDYYYRIVRVEKEAFADCKNLRELVLSDGIEEIIDRGLGGCAKLRKITIGKKLRKIGKQIVRGDRNLQEIYFVGGKLHKVSAEVFDNLPGKIKIRSKNIPSVLLEKKFAKAISSGKIKII